MAQQWKVGPQAYHPIKNRLPYPAKTQGRANGFSDKKREPQRPPTQRLFVPGRHATVYGLCATPISKEFPPLLMLYSSYSFGGEKATCGVNCGKINLIAAYAPAQNDREAELMSDFSMLLEKMLHENGYSVYGFAQEAGVDRPTLHRVLKGQLVPSAAFFHKALKALRLLPQEKELLEQTYHILRNGEEVFQRGRYIQKRLEHFYDVSAYRPWPAADAEEIAEEIHPPEDSLACVRGEYAVEGMIRRLLLEEIRSREEPALYTNMLACPAYAVQLLLQFYLQQEGHLQITHLIRLHKSMGDQMHNLAMLFDALLFSVSPGSGYRPFYYYENVSRYSDPVSLFCSYLIADERVLSLSEDLKVAALLREPEALACYERRFRSALAAAEPFLWRAGSAQARYRMAKTFFEKGGRAPYHIVSGSVACLVFCSTPELLRYAGRFVKPQAYRAFESLCRHYEKLAGIVQKAVVILTVDCVRRFLQTGFVFPFSEQFIQSFDGAARAYALEKILELTRAGRIRLYLMDTSRFRFPDGLSLFVNGEQNCMFFSSASARAGNVSVMVQEQTLRKALFDFVYGLPESGLVYTERESERILRQLMPFSQ